MAATAARTEAAKPAPAYSNIEWNNDTWRLDATSPVCHVIQNELTTYGCYNDSIKSRLASMQHAIERAQTDLADDLHMQSFDVNQINEMIGFRQAAASTVSKLLWAAEKTGDAVKV